jgi:hypothetical protein
VGYLTGFGFGPPTCTSTQFPFTLTTTTPVGTSPCIPSTRKPTSSPNSTFGTGTGLQAGAWAETTVPTATSEISHTTPRISQLRMVMIEPPRCWTSGAGRRSVAGVSVSKDLSITERTDEDREPTQLVSPIRRKTGPSRPLRESPPCHAVCHSKIEGF